MSTTLGQIIRERRMDLGITQEQLAERIGSRVRQAEVSRLERNHVQLPRRERLERIARALDLTVGELLVASGWMEQFAPIDLESGDALSPGPEAATESATLLCEMRRAEDLLHQCMETLERAHEATSMVEARLLRLRTIAT